MHVSKREPGTIRKPKSDHDLWMVTWFHEVLWELVDRCDLTTV